MYARDRKKGDISFGRHTVWVSWYIRTKDEIFKKKMEQKLFFVSSTFFLNQSLNGLSQPFSSRSGSSFRKRQKKFGLID